MGHLGKVGDEDVVADGLAEGYWELHLGVAESVAFEHGLHCHNLWFCVRHLDAYVALARDGRYDTYAQCRQREGYVVLEVLDFADADARSRLNLVEGDGGAGGGGDFVDLDAIVAQGLYDAVFVGDEFLFGHLYIGGLPVFEDVGGRHDEVA